MRDKVVQFKGKRVLVAMSGGVDSSVTAALLVKSGYEVIGITLKLFCYAKNKLQKKACCSMEAITDARAVCRTLGIKHYVIDCEDKFAKEIIDNFVTEYARGRTPNPCVRCNGLIKFALLFQKAKELGADFVATGHYAKIQKNKKTINQENKYSLLAGEDKEKDQSYFLYTLTQEQLKHLLFPIGGYTKSEVRNIAKRAGLKIHDKAESQEICFVENNYRDFLRERLGKKIKPGNIVDMAGKILGKHLGLPFYTLGQRKGIGLGGGQPFYVAGFNAKKNQLIVSHEIKDLMRQELMAINVNWISGDKPKLPFKVKAKIRYRHPGAEAIVTAQGKDYKVKFKKSQQAITPGQSVVFYKGREVLGGGIIKE